MMDSFPDPSQHSRDPWVITRLFILDLFFFCELRNGFDIYWPWDNLCWPFEAWRFCCCLVGWGGGPSTIIRAPEKVLRWSPPLPVKQFSEPGTQVPFSSVELQNSVLNQFVKAVKILYPHTALKCVYFPSKRNLKAGHEERRWNVHHCGYLYCKQTKDK